MTGLVRAVVVLAAAVAVVALLFLVVFPWVDRTFVTDPTLDAAQPAVVV